MGTQAADSRILMLSHACNMVLGRGGVLCSTGSSQYGQHINGSHCSHGKITWGAFLKKIPGQLSQSLWDGGPRDLYVFFKAQVESRVPPRLSITD